MKGILTLLKNDNESLESGQSKNPLGPGVTFSTKLLEYKTDNERSIDGVLPWIGIKVQY